MPLPDYITALGGLLDAAGHTWYVVGGCVRDFLLGVPPKDYDMCTSATPEQMTRIFAGYDLVLDGVKHGTVTVIANHIPVEITAYRIESGYLDSRHPESVVFTDRVEQDLMRRDFTVNAMAYHPQKGIIDLFGGREDLKAGVIRCVGDPTTRFGEDALRMLRCLRFAARFDFDIDPATRDAVKQNFGFIQNIAAERICSELQGFLDGAACGRVAAEFAGQIDALFAPLHTDVAALDQKGDFIRRLFWLLSQNESEAVRQKLKNMRFSTHISNLCADLILNCAPCDTVADMALLMGKYGVDFAKLWLSLRGNEAAKTAFDQILAHNIPTKVQQLNIKGADLIDAGIPAGPALGSCLQHLLISVLKNKVKNEKNALCTEAKGWYDTFGNSTKNKEN